MAESQDVSALKRRGRRRLVGAIALVLLAAIVLPMVFDQEPKPAVPPVSLRIPSEDDAKLSVKPPVIPGRPETHGAASADAEPRAAKPQPAAATGSPSAAPPAQDTDAKRPASAQPSSAQGSATQFVVPVAALASSEKVKELLATLKAAKLPHYTEPIATAKGTVTRVRVGPYADRRAAEDAAARLQGLGLKPGKVLEKS